ncbi:multidrug resistance protein, MATE family [Cognatiyoonia koreensis]|uniref:Multidrug resistance protein, MATE family n=1 Tax=Cognatiyoonia koreensis TaxID=364200 RepID=A0A1I0N885_9RHOB|nr:MATE family efflux transporter [Cognatiyoonia koreensis]SEV97245.1 multidrug resistance protein, MATE family [Cognatiyoonia koreensis]
MADLTHRRILHIAVPIVISNATVPILGLVDTGVVGQLGEAAPIGAVGIGAIILGSIYWIFGFLRMGTVGLTSQADGAGDTAEVTALFSRAVLIGMVAGAVIILAQGWLFREAFKISPASAEVESLARQYMAIRVWSAPAAIALYGVTGWLIAQERTRAVMAIQLLMNGANIGLDILFVIGFDWGVSGVAFATFIAEWSGLALGIWLCRDVFDHPAWRDRVRLLDPARLKKMAMVNVDILIRSVLLQAIFVSFMLFGSDFGDVPLAANQVLLQFLFFTSFAMDGFAFAVESLVGKAIGSKQPQAVRRASLMTGTWAAGICIAMALAFTLGGGLMIDVMTTAPDVRSAARAYLPYMIAAPLVGCAAWMFDGIFIGATRTVDMRNMMIVSTIIYFLSVIPLMAAYGNHGLWIGLLISFVVRGITLGLRYPALEAAAR